MVLLVGVASQYVNWIEGKWEGWTGKWEGWSEQGKGRGG